jgi:nitrite reductase/ring-hydroxylating ferredoxin subunit
VDGTVVTCPWHDSQFDIATGQPQRTPAEKPVPTYRVKVEGGAVFLAPQEIEAGLSSRP